MNPNERPGSEATPQGPGAARAVPGAALRQAQGVAAYSARVCLWLGASVLLGLVLTAAFVWPTARHRGGMAGALLFGGALWAFTVAAALSLAYTGRRSRKKSEFKARSTK